MKANVIQLLDPHSTVSIYSAYITSINGDGNKQQ
jgi:hypothetical protein